MLEVDSKTPPLWKVMSSLQTRSYPSYSGYLCRGSNSMLCRFSGSVSSQSRLSGTNLARGRVMGLLVANHCSSPRQWQQLRLICSSNWQRRWRSRSSNPHSSSRHKPNSTNASRRNRKYANKLPARCCNRRDSFKIWKTKFYSGTKVRSDCTAGRHKSERKECQRGHCRNSKLPKYHRH